MFDFIDCLEAERGPGYEPKQPLHLERAEQGLQCPAGLIPATVHGFSPVLTTAFALPEAIWIPQTSRNDTKHFGDTQCMVVYS